MFMNEHVNISDTSNMSISITYKQYKYLYIKSFRKKPTGTKILYRILKATYHRIYVNYKILTVSRLSKLK